MRRGDSFKIGLVKDDAVKTGKPRGGGNMSAQHKKSRDNLLRFNQTEDQKHDAAYMEEVDNFISGKDIGP